MPCVGTGLAFAAAAATAGDGDFGGTAAVPFLGGGGGGGGGGAGEEGLPVLPSTAPPPAGTFPLKVVVCCTHQMTCFKMTKGWPAISD